MKKAVFIVALLAVVLLAWGQTASLRDLRIVSPDGTYLGTLDSNQYNSESVYNQYGKGSPHGASSIMNKYSIYGSDYSDKSPFSSSARNAPFLEDKNGNRYGRLSVNRYAPGVTQQSYNIALELKSHRDSL